MKDKDWPKFRASYSHRCSSEIKNKDVKKANETDDHGDIIFHLHKPRFVAEVRGTYGYGGGGNGYTIIPTFIDDPGTDAQEIAALMKLTGDWYMECGGMLP